MLYTSINNQKIKNLKKLQIKKYRDKENLFLVETPHLVKEAYNKGYLKELLILEGESIDIDIETNEINDVVMNYLSSLSTPSKVIGICAKPKEKPTQGNVLMLDNIQDPGNLGTIIRSAVAFNINTIIISPSSADLYSDKVIRASEGMVFYPNILVKPLEQEVKKLKENNYHIYSTNVTFGKELKTIEKNQKFAIIMGNEGKGVSQSLLDLADDYLYIPMNKECESLNVAVATSIILYEISR